MSKKKASKPVTATKLVRQKARAAIGAVPATRVVPDPRRKPEKHKRDLTRDLADEASLPPARKRTEPGESEE